jgi:hypothetical protein
MMQADRKQHFTTTFSVDRTGQEAFEAITNVRGWWSQEVEGVTDQVGNNTGEGQPNPKEDGKAPAHQNAATVLRAKRSLQATGQVGTKSNTA